MQSTVKRDFGTYKLASILLYSRLWQRLEDLGEPFGQCAVESTDLQLEMFRLELIVLLDSCDSPRWSSLMIPEHRLELRSTIEDLWMVLAVSPADLGRHTFCAAQNLLLDSVQRFTLARPEVEILGVHTV